MKFTKEKGQGALEYLLIIAGAMIIAVTVIVLVIGMGGTSREQATESSERLDRLIDETLIPPVVRYISGCGAGAEIHLTPLERTDIYRVYVNNTPVNAGAGGAIHTAIDNVITLNFPPGTSRNDNITVSSIRNNLESRPSTPPSRCTP